VKCCTTVISWLLLDLVPRWGGMQPNRDLQVPQEPSGKASFPPFVLESTLGFFSTAVICRKGTPAVDHRVWGLVGLVGRGIGLLGGRATLELLQ